MPSRLGLIVGVLCVAEILSMTPFSMFLALQPTLQAAWQLSNTESGWISSAYYAGYMVAVPVLSSLTDRVDARTVWLGACATAAAGALAFAVGASGVWTAAATQAVAGAGLAGTYMPGLKVMADRVPAAALRPRHVAFYTTSFTAGAALSFWIVGRLGGDAGWRTAVTAAALGPAIGWGLVAWLLPPVAISAPVRASVAAHWRAVAGSGDTVRYVVGYATHTWELFALRAWLVPFVVFCGAASAPPLAAPTIAALVSLLGIPASIAGAEMTSHVSRRRLVVSIMITAVVCSLIVVPASRVGWATTIAAVCVYGWFVSADSAALTSGVLSVAPVASRGTAMAVYSTVGFAAASAGTFAVGAMLDLAGGQSAIAWALAFTLMGAPNLLGSLAIARTHEQW